MRPTTPARPAWRIGAIRCSPSPTARSAPRSRRVSCPATRTMGRIRVEPNATNAIPSRVTAWLDARAADQSILDSLVKAIGLQAAERAALDGTEVVITPESLSPGIEFDPGLRDRMVAHSRSTTGAAHRGRPRRGCAGGGRHRHQHAVRAQPDRRLARAGRARHRRRLRRGRWGPGRGVGGPPCR